MNEELTRGREQVSRFLRARRNATAAGAGAKQPARADAAGAFHAARPESSMYERLFALQRRLHSAGIPTPPGGAARMAREEWRAVVLRMRRRGFDVPTLDDGTVGENASAAAA